MPTGDALLLLFLASLWAGLALLALSAVRSAPRPTPRAAKAD
jgi:hypothetical protein